MEKYVYVETEIAAGDKRKWLIFDFDGQLQKKVMMDARGMKAFYKGNYYQLIENENSSGNKNEDEDETVWELYKTTIAAVPSLEN